MEQSINDASLHFSPQSLYLLNIIMGFIMFGVALELKPLDFKRILYNSKSALVGLSSQLILLPVLTIIFCTILLDLGLAVPSLALGMILIAACPGGNMSNFISMLAKGNTALSVSMTAVVTITAVFLTPVSFTFFAGMHPKTLALLEAINIDFYEMLKTVFLILGLPLLLGMLFNHYFSKITLKIISPIKALSLIAFISFVVVAFITNFDVFKKYILILAPLVFVHNLLGIAGAYLWSRLFNLPEADRRSVTIETCIQNSGLALVITFSFFQNSPAVGGMACIAGWWAIWHLVAGLSIAYFWSKRPPKPIEE